MLPLKPSFKNLTTSSFFFTTFNFHQHLALPTKCERNQRNTNATNLNQKQNKNNDNNIPIAIRIHRLQRDKIPPNECPGYNIKPSDTLDIWEMLNTHSLPLLPGSLWPRAVATGRVLSIGQLGKTMSANKWLMSNCDFYLAIIKTI